MGKLDVQLQQQSSTSTTPFGLGTLVDGWGQMLYYSIQNSAASVYNHLIADV